LGGCPGECQGWQEEEGMMVAVSCCYALASMRVSGRWYLLAKGSRNACRQHGIGPYDMKIRIHLKGRDMDTHLPCPTGDIKCAGQMIFLDFVITMDVSS
jgi:hypothetical protein